MDSEIELPHRVLDHIQMWSKVEQKPPSKVIEELIVAGACARLVKETMETAS